MKPFAPLSRRFLFLQGPPGPFFRLLGEQLRQRGHSVYRINLNGGDRADWPGEATDYRGGQSGWPRFIDRYLRDNRITDILLFGDCRPLHQAAHGMAKLRGVSIHVFEEGYIRPHWITMEPDGVNGHSRLSRDPKWFVEQAKCLPPLPPAIPITASFGRRAADALRYYTAVVVNRWRFPLYRSHRPGSVIVEGLGWLTKFARERLNAASMAETIKRIDKTPYFLFPLQLSSDYQIRAHSPFNSMRDAAIYVMESFALHAPAMTSLVVKEHPLDCSFLSWRSFVDRHARRLGISDRIIHVAGGDLIKMAGESLGMVTVNSTSGTLGLEAGTPVFVLGNAIYNIPGITHQGRLDAFWLAPTPPEKAIYDAFRRVLHARCLIPGGIASQSAIEILIKSAIARLLDDKAHIPFHPDMDRVIADQAAAEVAAVTISSTGA
ncbi:MAG: capsule biosynthesis protein [Sphingobium sp.]